MATELDRADLKYKSDQISLQLNTIQNIPISLSLRTQNPDSVYKGSAQCSSHRQFPPWVCIISSPHSVYQAPSILLFLTCAIFLPCAALHTEKILYVQFLPYPHRPHSTNVPLLQGSLPQPIAFWTSTRPSYVTLLFSLLSLPTLCIYILSPLVSQRECWFPLPA